MKILVYINKRWKMKTIIFDKISKNLFETQKISEIKKDTV